MSDEVSLLYFSMILMLWIGDCVESNWYPPNTRDRETDEGKRRKEQKIHRELEVQGDGS
jgi:hypothetical protein